MLEVVGLVGATPVTHTPVFEVTAADRAELRAVLGPPGRPRVVLHPGASDRRRRWPAERFAAVGDALTAAGADVLVTGIGLEREVVDEVCGRMRHPARSIVDGLIIGGLAALLADCALVISNDTGPLHLAAAVGTRTVGLFWIGNMINAAVPERGRHRPLISWTIHCPDCGLDCTRDIYPARTGGTGCRCAPSFIADIPVAEVEAEALDLLAAYRAEPAVATIGNPVGRAIGDPAGDR
jgi:ADP-heptose:LPS heptosyltransferase